MSTKIYDAWRLKKGVDPWALVATIRARAEAHVRAKLTELYTAWCEADTRPWLPRSPGNLESAAAMKAKFEANENRPYDGFYREAREHEKAWGRASGLESSHEQFNRRAREESKARQVQKEDTP